MKALTVTLGGITEGIASVIVGYGILIAIVHYIRNSILQTRDESAIRLQLGKTLGFALELLLAADIVRTALAPTWEDIGKLAAIAAIRTLLNFFLERELKLHANAEAETSD